MAPSRQTDQTWDVFISHASEDKDSVVRPLADELAGRGLQVWYDEYELKVGDSLRAKINEGLRRSRRAIVVLSPAFFGKHWTEEELDGLSALEAVAGEHRLLPVWHQLSHADVAARAPTLANRIAVTTADSIPIMAVKLIEALQDETLATRLPTLALSVEVAAVEAEKVTLRLQNISPSHATRVTLEPRDMDGRGVPFTPTDCSAVRAGHHQDVVLRRFAPDGSPAESSYDLLYADADQRVLKRKPLKFSMSHDVVSMDEHVHLFMDSSEPEQTFSAKELDPWPEFAEDLVQAFLFSDGWLLTGSTRWLKALRILDGFPPDGPAVDNPHE